MELDNTTVQTSITEANIIAFLHYLAHEERAYATIEKYGHAIKAFSLWLDGKPLTKEAAIAYKQELADSHAASSVNAALAALNGFFRFLNVSISVKSLKIQRSTFRPQEKELTKEEYDRLVEAAKSKGNQRLSLVMQAICSTGIRVSELKYLTVEAIRNGRAEITNKGKTRTVLIPSDLRTALLNYSKKCGLFSGCIFVTAGGKPLDRKNIWADMKKLCEDAGIKPSKVFPHNLRRVFARRFYSVDKDLSKLADLLGHSSIVTTRIYICETGREHQRLIDRLDLVPG